MLLILTAAASTKGVTIQRKLLGSRTTLLISNEEIDDIMKIDKTLKESGLLIRGVSETIKTKQQNKNVDFSTCNKIYLVPVYQEIWGHVKEQGKEQ